MAGDTQARKEAAVEFLQLVVAGRIDEAYEKHVEMRRQCFAGKVIFSDAATHPPPMAL